MPLIFFPFLVFCLRKAGTYCNVFRCNTDKKCNPDKDFFWPAPFFPSFLNYTMPVPEGKAKKGERPMAKGKNPAL